MKIPHTSLNSVDFSSPRQLKSLITNSVFRQKMISWVEKTLRPLENNENYLKIAKGDLSDQKFKIDTSVIKSVLDAMMPYVLLGTPAHDLGHHIFDALGGSALISHDPFIAKGYKNDINAAFFAAMFHDNTTGVQHRYVDNKWQLNHGEIAAVVFYFNTAKILPQNLRLLTAYAIAAHPHATKEIVCQDGSVRKTWADELFYADERPVRLAVWVTRWTDRLENGGDPATHFPRHVLATADGAINGGIDFGTDWYKLSDQLKIIFTPEIITLDIPEIDCDGHPICDNNGLPIVNHIPTVLKHLRIYRLSADPSKVTIYNQHDSLSAQMKYLSNWKIVYSDKFIETVVNKTDTPDFEKLIKLLTLKSGFPLNSSSTKAIDLIRQSWKQSDPEEKRHWALGFDMALQAYHEWISILVQEINEATDPTVKSFLPLLPSLLKRIQ